LNNGITGTVHLLLFINERGDLTNVLVERSSGSEALDDAASSAARHWVFNPEMRNGVAVSSIDRQPVAFDMAPASREIVLEGSKSIEKTTLETLVRMAEKGSVDAQQILGWIYMKGEGLPQNSAKAMEWLEKADAEGNSWVENNIGWILAQGEGVPKDSAKAMGWYRKAAAQGNVYAFGNIGWMYEHGEGVARDDVLAYAWLTLAAKHGLDALAAAQGAVPETKDLPALEKILTPDQLNQAKRLASTWAKGQLLTRDAK
jgi:TonB family protein